MGCPGSWERTTGTQQPRKPQAGKGSAHRSLAPDPRLADCGCCPACLGKPGQPGSNVCFRSQDSSKPGFFLGDSPSWPRSSFVSHSAFVPRGADLDGSLACPLLPPGGRERQHSSGGGSAWQVLAPEGSLSQRHLPLGPSLVEQCLGAVPVAPQPEAEGQIPSGPQWTEALDFE